MKLTTTLSTAEGKNEWSQASIPAHAFKTAMPSILTFYNTTISEVPQTLTL
jgi:hypothetical protein